METEKQIEVLKETLNKVEENKEEKEKTVLNFKQEEERIRNLIIKHHGGVATEVEIEEDRAYIEKIKKGMADKGYN